MKKILIIENIVHYKNAIETWCLLSQKFNVDILIPKTEYSKIVRIKKKNILTFGGFNFLIYLKVFFLQNRYDYIYISTCPEYPDNINSFKGFIYFFLYYISFLIFLILLRKKVIIQIRSIHRYFPKIRESGILRFFRFLFVIICKRFVLESEFLYQKFNLYLKNYKLKKKTTYSYIANADKYMNKKFVKKYNKRINLGILGGIDPDRKDYSLLREILIQLKKKKKFNLIFLGSAINSSSERILNQFKEILPIKYSLKYIMEKKFKKWGKDCDILMSLNTRTNYYGKYRLSGSFGDSINLQKKLIAPFFEDPLREFSDFTTYYKSKNHLLKILSSKSLSRFNCKFDKFRIKKNLERISKNLSL